MERWDPPVELTAQEEMLLKRLNRVRPLFGFLRRHRHALFEDAFQAKLEEVYRDTGAGEEPHPPALLCMVVLLQGYVGASDAEAVELSVGIGRGNAFWLAIARAMVTWLPRCPCCHRRNRSPPDAENNFMQ
jgi:hypothetical protein